MALIPEVFGQLDLHRPPPHPLGQPAEQPAGPTISSSVRAPASSSDDDFTRQLVSHPSGNPSRIPGGGAVVWPNASPPAPAPRRLGTLARLENFFFCVVVTDLQHSLQPLVRSAFFLQVHDR